MPESQTEEGINKQIVEISVNSSKEWTEWAGKYAWNTSYTEQPVEEDWRPLTLEEKSSKEKTGKVLKTTNEDGEYYLWIQIATKESTTTKSFGPYKLEKMPTEKDIICVLKSKNEDNTKGIVEIGSSKVFSNWKLSYTVNDGVETEITDGTTEIEVVKNDYIEVKYSKPGEVDIIKTLKVTELKIGYVLKYDATEGAGAPSNQIQYDNQVFTISSIKPTRAGYDFIGWTINADRTGIVYSIGETITVNDTITLYAKWKVKVVTTTITYLGNGGTYNSKTELVQNVSANSAVTLASNNFTKSMHQFVCWVLPDGTEYNAYSVYNIGEQPITLSAKWEKLVSREMDYLITTGNQYIDTGFKPNQDTIIEIKFQLLSAKASFIYGVRDAIMNADIPNSYSMAVYKKKLRSDYYNTQKQFSIDCNKAHIIKQEKNNTYLDNVLNNSHTYISFTNVSNKDLLLFNVDTAGVINKDYCAELKFYYCKIWNNGTLVRDYIPVIDNKGKVCIFDKVANSFCKITYGNEQEDLLPEADVIEVGSVDTTGTQYIDTGLKANQDTSVEMKFKLNSSVSQCLYGARTTNVTNSYSGWFVNSGSSNANRLRFDYYTVSANTSYGTYPSGNIYTVYQNKNINYINNIQKGSLTYKDFTTPGNLYLCALNNNGTLNYFATMTLYYCKIWSGDTLVRDYVPVLNLNSEFCLYDKVEQKYYKGLGGNLEIGQ